MPNVAPALPLASPLSAPVGTGGVGDMFAALVQRLAVTPPTAVESAVAVGTAVEDGAALPLSPDDAEPVLAWDPADAMLPMDATAVPAPAALPAGMPSASEPALVVAVPTAGAPSGATASAPGLSVAVPVAPPVREPPVREGRDLGATSSLATNPPEDGSRCAATAAGVPHASAPAGDPAPPAALGLLEVAASDGEAPARPLATRDGPPAVARRPDDPIGAVPMEGRAEAPPAASTRQNASPTTLSMASASGAGRRGQDHHVALVSHGAADSAVATAVADRAAEFRVDLPIVPTTAALSASYPVEGVRGPLATPGPAPVASDGPDAVPVGLTPQLTVAIVRHAADGLDRVKVQLQPEELGTVEIALELGDDGRARAAFLAERPETVDLLRREAGDLERALRQVGVEVGTGDMSFAARDPHGGRDQQPGTRMPAPPGDPEPGAARERRSPTTSGGVSSRLLDLTV